MNFLTRLKSDEGSDEAAARAAQHAAVTKAQRELDALTANEKAKKAEKKEAAPVEACRPPRR